MPAPIGPTGGKEMSILQLMDVVSGFPETTPISDRLSAILNQRKKVGQSEDERKQNFKEGILQWLREYHQPGYYKRKEPGKSAKYMYNHLQSPDGIIYLAEAAGVSEELLERAFQAASDPLLLTKSSQSGAVRELIPWEAVEKQIEWNSE
jgi:hypothetical protein